MMITRRAQMGWLIAGDVLAILVMTMMGFLTHYGDIQGWRWLTTFLPVLAAWFAIAPWLGVYRADLACQPRQVWRPVLAALLSAPLAATLRGAWLNAAVLPLFVGVLGLTNALGFLVWRGIWAIAMHRVVRHAGTVHG
jgi:hypothetical protein